MPRIHLGVYLTSGQETSNAVQWALEVLATQHVQVPSADDMQIRPAIERMIWVEVERSSRADR